MFYTDPLPDVVIAVVARGCSWLSLTNNTRSLSVRVITDKKNLAARDGADPHARVSLLIPESAFKAGLLSTNEVVRVRQ